MSFNPPVLNLCGTILQMPFPFVIRLEACTLRLHYNADLYNAVTAWLPNIFPVYYV